MVLQISTYIKCSWELTRIFVDFSLEFVAQLVRPCPAERHRFVPCSTLISLNLINIFLRRFHLPCTVYPLILSNSSLHGAIANRDGQNKKNKGQPSQIKQNAERNPVKIVKRRNPKVRLTQLQHSLQILPLIGDSFRRYLFT